MKALVKYKAGAGNVEVREVEEPACGEEQVKIEVAYCGICGTDLHVYHDTFRNYPPVVLGHEFSGTVVEAGKNVRHVAPGDRVAVLPASAVTCGTCRYCRSGHFMFCPERRGMGHGVNGALARYAVVRKDQAYKVPRELSLEEAALCEPLAAVMQPVAELSGARPGDIALVSGPGPIGLLCLKLLVAAGIRTIVAGAADDSVRSERARLLGASRVVNVGEEDLASVVREETSGAGADVAFECAGAAASARNCLKALRPLGTYVQVGIFGKEVTLDLDLIIYKQLRVLGSVGYTAETWNRVLRVLAQGKLRLGDVISHRLPLDRWQEAFDLCERKAALKVLMVPGQ